mmetsp:Transcript_27393/g.47291  ORF Transcript_27393/g.47291 Transcript_27393/m.47291 type:complete len:188 (-) Transcript_27393:395-958(-)
MIKIGQIVWARTQGHPWWPAQVADKSKITTSKIVKKAGDKTILVKYFGGSTFGWFHEKDLLPFEQHYEDKIKPSGRAKELPKSLQDAIAEAKGALGDLGASLKEIEKKVAEKKADEGKKTKPQVKKRKAEESDKSSDKKEEVKDAAPPKTPPKKKSARTNGKAPAPAEKEAEKVEEPKAKKSKTTKK